MPSNPLAKNDPEAQFEREARRMLDQLALGQLSEEEFAQLEQRLLDDAAFRQAYVEQAIQEADLEHQLRSAPPVLVEASSWSDLRFNELRWPLAITTALSLLLLMGLVYLLLAKAPPLAPQASPMVTFTESSLSGSRPVAIVIRTSDAEDPTSPVVGDRIKPGALRVHRGELQLEFVNGVRMRLNGPSEVHLISEMEATLIQGQASVVTPPDAQTFYLNGPISAIANGASEFAYEVTDETKSHIDVYQGEVMASLLGVSGDTLRNELVTANHMAVLSEEKLDVLSAVFAEQDRVSVIPIDDVSLNTTARYAALVKEDSPLVYWRFDESDITDGMVRNHMSDRYLGRLVSPGDDSLITKDGAIHFGKSFARRYLKLDEPIEGLNRGDFTVELWVRAQRLHWGTFLGILPVEQLDADRHSHLCLLEYANKTNLVHRPATVRLLYRYPARSFTGGLNSFSSQACIPGLWTHVVGVKSHEGTKLFVNGEQIVISDELRFNDDMAYTAVIGQLDSVRTLRQFQGQVDEIAIYTKALTPKQIRRHYETMTGPPQT